MFALKSSFARTMVFMVAVTAAAGLSRGVRAGDAEAEWKELHVTPHVQHTPAIGAVFSGVSHVVGHSAVPDKDELWKSMEKKLEEAGLEKKQLKKVREALESAWKDHADKSNAHTVIRGKVKMIDPETGKVEEIDLTENDIKWEELEGEAARSLVFAKAGPERKYLIGVECKDIDEPLRAQLQLDEGVGLLVISVVKDMPGKEAGLRKNDVLIRADDGELTETKDLIDAIQSAGKRGEKLSLTLIRNGEKKTITVAPEERKSIGLNLSQLTAPPIVWNIDPDGAKHIGPALNVTKSPTGSSQELRSLKKQIEQIGRKLDRLQEEIADLKKQQ